MKKYSKIPTKLKKIVKQKYIIGQQSIANNFEKILYIYGKKFVKIDEVNPFILHKGIKN